MTIKKQYARVRNRNYYLKHIEKFKKKHLCECGNYYTISNFFNHCKTKKHKSYL